MQKQLEAERFQVEELERNLLSQVIPLVAHSINVPAPILALYQDAASQEGYQPMVIWLFSIRVFQSTVLRVQCA